jgi:hypothetical protein
MTTPSPPTECHHADFANHFDDIARAFVTAAQTPGKTVAVGAQLVVRKDFASRKSALDARKKWFGTALVLAG